MPLGDNNLGWSPNYLDAKEVMELFHVRHLEFAGDEGVDLVDVAEMLTSNDKIIVEIQAQHWVRKPVRKPVHRLGA